MFVETLDFERNNFDRKCTNSPMNVISPNPVALHTFYKMKYDECDFEVDHFAKFILFEFKTFYDDL